ncbi:hypothetical protein BC826DRAFT_230568 [Russula brevipes]|nr:hypothetical protein BC826DRAFT_230568 [Russula brevipes]
MLLFDPSGIRLELDGPHGSMLRVSYRRVERQIDSLARVCRQLSLSSLLSNDLISSGTIRSLNRRGRRRSVRPYRRTFPIICRHPESPCIQESRAVHGNYTTGAHWGRATDVLPTSVIFSLGTCDTRRCTGSHPIICHHTTALRPTRSCPSLGRVDSRSMI